METDSLFLPLIMYIFSAFGIAILLFSISFFAIPRIPDIEKFAMYECGFTPRDNTKQPFNIHFYVVGLLFILFDIEITFLFPLVMIIDEMSYIGFISIYIFFFVLFLGIFYEWTIGVLDWE
jgi:NADH:ubiquinone oxidoreductase subunit 3 (subunit A)